MYTEVPWNNNQLPGFLRMVPVKVKYLLPVYQESEKRREMGGEGQIFPSLPTQLVHQESPH